MTLYDLPTCTSNQKLRNPKLTHPYSEWFSCSNYYNCQLTRTVNAFSPFLTSDTYATICLIFWSHCVCFSTTTYISISKSCLFSVNAAKSFLVAVRSLPHADTASLRSKSFRSFYTLTCTFCCLLH